MIEPKAHIEVSNKTTRKYKINFIISIVYIFSDDGF
jgi:hypothetical protein